MTPEDELLRAAPLKEWFHSIEIAPGVWTNGHKSREVMAYELSAWRFPEDLTGKRVLDIGCADGGWSIAALERGAASVLAIDERLTPGIRRIKAANRFPKIEVREMSLFSDAFMALPKFDFVIFTGVLYHVQDMLEALKRVRSRVTWQVMMETHLNNSLGVSPPMAVFYEHDELGDDPTNWWGPNLACLEAMLRTADFEFEGVNLIWQDATYANGRVAFRLQPGKVGLFDSRIGDAMAADSALENARRAVDRLTKENTRLRAEMDLRWTNRLKKRLRGKRA